MKTHKNLDPELLAELADWEDDEVGPAPVPTGSLVASFLFLFAFIPICYALHHCTFVPGVRTMLPGYSYRLCFYFVCFWAAVHVALIRPMATMVYPQVETKSVPGMRILFVILMTSLPLLSFAYFLSSFHEVMDLHELFLAVVPAVAISAFLFESTRDAIATSFFLALSVFVPIFVINDILSPFATAVSYASTSPGLYIFRTLFPVLAVWYGATRILGDDAAFRRTSPPPAESLRSWIFAAWGIFLYTIVATWAVPIATSYVEKKALLLPTDFWWLTQFATMFFLLVRTRLGYRLALAAGLTSLFVNFFRTSQFFVQPAVNVWALFNFGLTLTVGIFYAFLLARLARPQFRRCFG